MEGSQAVPLLACPNPCLGPSGSIPGILRDCLYGRAAPKLDLQKARSEELRTSTDMAQRANSAPPKQELPSGALRVLVAEDNLVNQKVLQKVLQRVTPESPIFIANNGQEALQVIYSTLSSPCQLGS